ncbi:MAG: DUF2157 domain-containing protein, partial [Nitrospinae bacterium]|nr:DUF2157 domain-containing protein [Nitrospinota bacterium]
FNWGEIGRFAKFGMAEVFMILALVVYWRKYNAFSGKVSLLVASILLGVLLALFGQTYQTGADTWQLFFNWALLILPWAFIGRFAALWFLWIVLVNISIVLYYQTFQSIFWFIVDGEMQTLWVVFFVNTCILILWEIISKKLRWLAEGWVVRVIAVTSGFSITWLVLNTILDSKEFNVTPLLVWILFIISMYWVYRKIQPDLFMLAGCCLSGIIIIVSLAGNYLFETWDGGEEFLLALLVIGLGSSSAYWLKKLHKEFNV